MDELNDILLTRGRKLAQSVTNVLPSLPIPRISGLIYSHLTSSANEGYLHTRTGGLSFPHAIELMSMESLGHGRNLHLKES